MTGELRKIHLVADSGTGEGQNINRVEGDPTQDHTHCIRLSE